jgi:hypothetical protein
MTNGIVVSFGSLTQGFYMLRFAFAFLLLATVGQRPPSSPAAPSAWPHRAIVTALHDRPVAFRAYTRGGVLIIAVDASGRRTATPAPIPVLRALTEKDTIHAETPADFPLDLSEGPVVFVADGNDSLNVVVGRNPYGSIARVSARGRRLTARLVAGNFVIDAR